MAELTPDAYEAAAHELVPLQRAMLVLVSETCVVPELAELDVQDEQGALEISEESEEQMANTIDGLFEEAAIESEGGAQTSLMQSESLLGQMFKWVGAIFFAIAFGLACAAAGYIVGAVIGALTGILYCSAVRRGCGGGSGLAFPVMGIFVAVPLGFATCFTIPLIEASRRA